MYCVVTIVTSNVHQLFVSYFSCKRKY